MPRPGATHPSLSFRLFCAAVFLLAVVGTIGGVWLVKSNQPSPSTLIPQPAFDYSNDYEAPFNVTITCTHTGGPGEIDPNKPPVAGQRLIRDCVVTELAPRGIPVQPLVG